MFEIEMELHKFSLPYPFHRPSQVLSLQHLPCTQPPFPIVSFSLFGYYYYPHTHIDIHKDVCIGVCVSANIKPAI